MVIRDSTELVIGALSQKIRHPGSVDMVEALAANKAIVLAKKLLSSTYGGGGGFSTCHPSYNCYSAFEDYVWSCCC